MSAVTNEISFSILSRFIQIFVYFQCCGHRILRFTSFLGNVYAAWEFVCVPASSSISGVNSLQWGGQHVVRGLDSMHRMLWHVSGYFTFFCSGVGRETGTSFGLLTEPIPQPSVRTWSVGTSCGQESSIGLGRQVVWKWYADECPAGSVVNSRTGG